jgi:hypothetical protein
MNQEDFPAEPSEHRKIWSFTTVHISRRRSGYFRNGIEHEVPKVHELVIMDGGDALSIRLDRHPEDVENRFRLKKPLLVAIKHDAYECFQVLLQRDANIEEYNPQNETALLIAVRLNRMRMVDDLIARDASILPEDRMARTVTEILISIDDVETLLHIQRGNLLDHDLHNEELPLTLAISHQARKCIDYILSLKPKAQSFLIRRKYNCPISAAIRKNDVRTMERLVTLEEFPYIVNKRIHKSVSYIHLAV